MFNGFEVVIILYTLVRVVFRRVEECYEQSLGWEKFVQNLFKRMFNIYIFIVLSTKFYDS